MKYLHCCVIILFAMMTKAQNWQPFQVDSFVYFNGKEVKGFRLDSIRNNEYFGYKGAFLEVESSLPSNVKAHTGNWFAIRMKFIDNKLIFNKHYDRLYVTFPNQLLSDTLFDTLYIYSKNGTISTNKNTNNTIISSELKYEKLWNGLFDSVKYFYTNSNSDTLILSKNFGVIQWYGKRKRINPIKLITNKMMHDFNIGDIVQYKFQTYLNIPGFYERKVIDKKSKTGGAEFTFLNTWEYYKFNPNQPGIIPDFIKQDTVKLFLPINDNPIYSQVYCMNKLIIPDEIINGNGKYGCVVKCILQSHSVSLLDSTIYFTKFKNKLNYTYNNLEVYIDPNYIERLPYIDTVFAVGPWIYSVYETDDRSFSPPKFRLTLEHYTTKQGSYGIPHYFLKSKPVKYHYNSISFNNNFIFLNNTSQLTDIKVFDATGKAVIAEQLRNNNKVAISKLKTGIYFVVAVNLEGIKITKSIIKF